MKIRSRILILSHIAQFSLGREVAGMEYAGLKDMRFRENREPAIGSLVAPQSARSSKWYLSWVHEVIWHTDEQGRKRDATYVLESIEDEQLCNWSNVGMLEYDRSQVDSHPEWRWTDRQHEFNDKWCRSCYRDRDAYITLPTQASFGKDNSVTVGTRTRYGMDDHTPSRTFPDWRKVTKAQLLEFYDEAAKEKKVA